MSSIRALISVALWLPLLLGCTGSGKKGEAIAETITEVSPEPSVAAESRPTHLSRLADTIFPSAKVVKYKVIVADTSRSGFISDLSDLYEDSKSVLTFRGRLFRQGLCGHLDTIPTQLRTLWRIDTKLETLDTIYGPWGGGTGWTGQPLYVEWPDSVAETMKRNGAVTPAFAGKEVIVGSLCGSLYFLDPTTGNATRSPIDVGNPIKGTPSVDPTLCGNVYVGQGVPAKRPFGALVVNLLKNRIADFFAEDTGAWRRWGANDSSPVRVGDFLFRPCENGTLYKYYIAGDGAMRLHSLLRYRVNGVAPGLEASMAVYANYGFVTDNQGNVIAINLDTLTPVWAYSLPDDTDATPLIAVEEGTPYIYVGCEVDRSDSGVARFAKLQALTGMRVWDIGIPAVRREKGSKHFDGGFYASPLLGEGDCSGLIFSNVVENTNGPNGAFIAINRKDGTVAYTTPLSCYSWSSPVGFLTAEGKMIILTGDAIGNLYLIEGSTGRVISRRRVGYNFESSPLVLANTVIIGSRGNGIFKVAIE